MEFERVLVVGVGESFGFGADTKIRIFEKLRPHAKILCACDLGTNQLVSSLHNSHLIDFFFPVQTLEPYAACKELTERLREANFRPDVVVTYREECLQLRSLVADHYGLPHPPLAASQISQDKHRTKEVLENAGIASATRHQTSTLENLPTAGPRFGFPLFLKPITGMGSSWARLISDQKALDQFIEDVKQANNVSADILFLMEEVLKGHEVDVDIAIYQGRLVYGAVIDNFPLYEPFAKETGDLMPSILLAKSQDALIQYAFQAALTCGYDRGVLHVELILKSNDDIALIEINGRLNGVNGEWHEEVWGVDLIAAELAISAGRDPAPFLKKSRNPKKALAQLWVTTNQDKESDADTGTVEVQEWTNLQDFQSDKNVVRAGMTLTLPCKSEIAVYGHACIGAITVEAETSRLAFQKLRNVLENRVPVILTSNGLIETSTRVLKKFCSDRPGLLKDSQKSIEKFSTETVDPFQITHVLNARQLVHS